MSEKVHAEAVRAALTAALDPWAAYDYDDAPNPLPHLYALATVTRRGGAPIRACGGVAQWGYRVTVLAVGRSVDEARHVRDQVDTLVGAWLTVGGRDSTRIRFETATPIEPDDGRYSGMTTYTYAH